MRLDLENVFTSIFNTVIEINKVWQIYKNFVK